MEKRERYLFPTGLIRVLETRLLGPEQIERMVQASSFDDALRVLGEVGYREDAFKEGVEAALEDELRMTYSVLLDACPDPAIVDMFRLGHDVHNLKVWAKLQQGLIEEGEEMWVDLGTMPAGEAEIPGIADVIARYKETKDPGVIDAGLDVLWLGTLLGRAPVPVRPIVKVYIDYCNLKTLVRAREMGKAPEFVAEALVPGGDVDPELLLEVYGKPEMLDWIGKRYNIPTGTSIEQAMHDELERQMERVRYTPYGVESVFLYLFRKRQEIARIRAILMGKLNGLHAKEIEEMLCLI